MPDKFVVPQFIDNEDKILGPITVRQFLICLAAVFVLFLEYRFLATLYFVLSGLPTAMVAGVFAFAKINGHPFHIFFLNVVQTSMRPRLRVWRREMSAEELKALITHKVEPKPIVTAGKARPSMTHLRDLSLTVNTGGVYNAEE